MLIGASQNCYLVVTRRYSRQSVTRSDRYPRNRSVIPWAIAGFERDAQMLRGSGFQVLTTRGSETPSPPLVTSITQRPSHGSVTSIPKKANPGNSPTTASGASNHLDMGSSSVGGLISTSTRRSESSASGRVSTTSTNRANRSGPTVYLESTPPWTLSLLSTVAAASARKAPPTITGRT